MREGLGVWSLRGLLAALLLVCSEVLWWSNNPSAYTPGEWVLLAGLYLALAALLLDLLARFAVTDVLGLLVVAGLYGLLNGALIAHSAFGNLPLSLVSRPLGLHTLGGGIVGLGLWLWLLDGRGLRPGRALICAAIGLLWGVWVRWFPLLPSNGYPLPALPDVLAMAALGFILIGLLVWIIARLAPALPDEHALQLSWGGWIVVIGTLLAAFLIGASRGAIQGIDGAVLGLLAGYLIALLVFMRGTRGTPLLRRIVSPRPASLPSYFVYAVLLIVPAALGYSLPGAGPDGPPLQWLTAALTGFGIAWLPGVSLAIGLRTYTRLFRQAG